MVAIGERVAPGRLRPKEERSRGGVKPRRGRGRGKQAILGEEVSDVYRDMLRDVVGASAKRPEELSDSDESQPPKKRKVAANKNIEAGLSLGGDKGKNVLVEDSEDDAEKAIEDVDNESDVGSDEESEEGSGESEVDWEEVDLSKQSPSSRITPSLHVLLIASLAMGFATEPPKPEQPLEIILDQKNKQKAGCVRRTITAVDRRIRLEVHKMHLLCLLIHVYQRSRWCNDSNAKVIYLSNIFNRC